MLTQYCLSDKIKKNVMVGACSTYGEKGEVYTVYGLGNLRRRDHLEYSGVDGRIILRYPFRK
jgi:hypothetical protein